jgi:hypothetical protein
MLVAMLMAVAVANARKGASPSRRTNLGEDLMIRRSALLAAAILALVALVAMVLGTGATAAEARKKLPTATTARFKAELSGTQFARTDVGDIADNDCELPSGTSTERIEFRSSTFRVEIAEPTPGEIFLGRTGVISIPVGGTVTRSNIGSAACQDDPRAPEDCGVIPIRTWHTLKMQWRTRGFQLLAGGVPDSDPFENCSPNLLDNPFPSLFGASDDEPQVVARVSLRDTLDRPKVRTVVAEGHGSTTFGSDKAQGSVALDWRITMTRLKTKKPHRKR